MPRSPNYQHVPYVPDHERPLWEVAVDYVFPPIRFPDGQRFDDDYLERFWFHVFGVGGPLAEEDNRYHQPHLIWKLLDARDAVANAYTEYCQSVRTKWEWYTGACSARLNRVSGWFGSKTGWTTRWKPMLRRSKMLQLCGVVDEDDDVESQYYDPTRQTPPNDDFQRYPYFGFIPSPTPTERTCLLQHASLSYAVISTSGQDDDDDDGEYDCPVASSPPKNGRPPSALSSSKKGVLRKLYIWGLKPKRPKSVRFTNTHNVLLFDKLPWEPTGCYKACTVPRSLLVSVLIADILPNFDSTKPDYSHLTEPHPDPQIEAIVSMLHAVSSASRQSPPQSPYPALSTWTTRVVPCES